MRSSASRDRRPVRIVLAAVVTLALVGACASASQRYELSVAGVTLSVEVADDPQSRARGLMERTELGEREGMLFVFESSEPRSFWMKNTPLPLSIAYVDDRWIIREIHAMEPGSLEPVPSRHPARYALEVNRGAFERLGIDVGDRLVPSSALRERIGY